MSGVYFIEAVDTGHFKVGMSNTPLARFADLQRANPQHLELLAVLGMKVTSPRKELLAVERRFHERYLPFHHRAEWFHVNGLMRADVLAIRSGSFDMATLPAELTEASLFRYIHRGPRLPDRAGTTHHCPSPCSRPTSVGTSGARPVAHRRAPVSWGVA